MLGLMDGFRGYLPEGFEVQVTGSDHDLGSWVLGSDQREKAMELVREGQRESFQQINWGGETATDAHDHAHAHAHAHDQISPNPI
jgi:hypothetical protein